MKFAHNIIIYSRWRPYSRSWWNPLSAKFRDPAKCQFGQIFYCLNSGFSPGYKCDSNRSLFLNLLNYESGDSTYKDIRSEIYSKNTAMSGSKARKKRNCLWRLKKNPQLTSINEKAKEFSIWFICLFIFSASSPSLHHLWEDGIFLLMWIIACKRVPHSFCLQQVWEWKLRLTMCLNASKYNSIVRMSLLPINKIFSSVGWFFD